MAQLSDITQGGFRLKLMINTQTNKVVFAEAGKDLVDFLFSIMLLPLGTVVSLLGKQSVPDGLANLHHSIKILDTAYISSCTDTSSDQLKAELLNPSFRSWLSQGGLRLPWNSSTAAPNDCLLYKCFYNHHTNFVSEVIGVECPMCSREMVNSVALIRARDMVRGPSDHGTDKGFVKELVTYTITDDLCIAPLSTVSSLNGVMKKRKVNSLGNLKEKKVMVGVEQGMKILETALRSNSVLSDVFL